MARPWPLRLLLAAGALALVSLYLPWQEAPSYTPIDRGDSRGNSFGILNLFGPQHVDGWSTVGELLALSALLVVVLAALALLRPGLADRLPLGQAALALGFFSAAVLAQTHYVAAHPHASGIDADFHIAYGAFVGLAAGLVALAAAAALRRDELASVRDARQWPSRIAALVLLAALLLPWTRTQAEVQSLARDTLGIGLAPGAIVAVLAVRLLAVRARSAALAALALLFTAGALAVDALLTRRYGAWIGLAAAIVLLAVALVEQRRVPLRLMATVPGVALAVLAASLFGPWQRVCYADGTLAQLGLTGRCATTNGWSQATSAGLLVAVCLVAVLLALVAQAPARLELAAALALLVGTAGLRLETATLGDGDFGIAYGAIAGFVGAATLIAIAATRVGLGRRAAAAAAGAAAAGAALGGVFVASVVAPWWDVTSFGSGLTALTWLSIAAALVAIRLTGRWLARATGGPADGDELVALPLVLGTLVALDAVRFGLDDLGWSTALLAGIAVALAALGLVERAGGFAHVRVPDLLRLDRI